MRVVLGLLLGLLLVPGYGQSTPAALETEHLLGLGRPAGVPPLPLEDELYVLAWGSNNRIGYLEHLSMPGKAWVFRARVFDLVDDAVVWERTWVTDEELESFWSREGGALGAVLEARGLEPLDYQLGEFPVILDDEYYTAVLRRTAKADDPTVLGRLEVVVQSTGRGLKTVTDLTGAWRWATVLGFIPSPFENRLAIVLLVQPEGWAGVRQPLRFLLSGASLKAGFALP